MQVSPGASVTIGGNVFTVADNKPLIGTATVYVLLQLHRPGDVDHGKYWDANDDTWQAAGSVVAWPTAAYSHGSWWDYATDVLASAGKEGGTLKITDLTDDATTPASQTTIAGGMEAAEVSPVTNALIADLVESQRPEHTWQLDQSFYVDPFNGSDITGNGTRGQPYATVTKALSVTSDSHHTVIFLVAGNSAGPTILDERFDVDKRYTFIRGPGTDFIVRPTTTGDTVTVSAEGVSLSKMRIETHTAGVGRGIVVNDADACKLEDVWVGYTRGHAIHILNAAFARVKRCHVFESGQSGAGHGIVLDPTSGDVDHCRVSDCSVLHVEGDGIRIDVGQGVGNKIHHCEVAGATGVGINVRGGNDAAVHDNVLWNNAGGDIVDTATDTLKQNNEQWSTETALALVQADTTEIIADVAAVQTTADEILTALLADGAYAVTLQIRDLLASTVPGAYVDIFNAAGDKIGNVYDANLDGDVIVYLNAGDYQARAVAPYFDQTTKPVLFTVTADGSFEIAGTLWAPPAPSSAEKCVIFADFASWGAVVKEGDEVIIRAATPTTAQGKVLTQPTTTGVVNAAGRVTMEGFKAADVLVTIEAAGWCDVPKTVPDAPGQDIATW